MEKYFEPQTEIIDFESIHVLCASFDSKDKTENWFFDEEETL